jgi:hypothetical protein
MAELMQHMCSPTNRLEGYIGLPLHKVTYLAEHMEITCRERYATRSHYTLALSYWMLADSSAAFERRFGGFS